MTQIGPFYPSSNRDWDNEPNWSNPANAYADDGNVTQGSNNETGRWEWGDFGITTIPAGATIDGISIEAEVRDAFNDGGSFGACSLSWDGGASAANAEDGNWTTTEGTAAYQVSESSSTLTLDTAGGTALDWGRTWSPSEFTDANFVLRVLANDATTFSEDLEVDFWRVLVDYTAAGGANPKGPLGHPLHGPFAGPVGP